MDDPLGVKPVKAGRDVHEDWDELIGGERARLRRGEAIRERSALAQVHDDERLWRGCHIAQGDVVDADDVWMADRGQHPRLAFEPRRDDRVHCVVGEKHLDRDVTFEPQIVGAEDRREPSRANQSIETVAPAQALPDPRHARRVPDAHRVLAPRAGLTVVIYNRMVV